MSADLFVGTVGELRVNEHIAQCTDVMKPIIESALINSMWYGFAIGVIACVLTVGLFFLGRWIYGKYQSH
jgi:hypothetical protein